jgi:ACT domain-containing protein
MSDSQDEVHAYTIRLELVDEPGELLRALSPIADNGGNLLSIFHERGNVTPRGHIPVEVDLEATPERFETIVDALQAADFDIIQAGADRYTEGLTVVLSGHLVRSDLSDTLSQIQDAADATVTDLSLSAPDGTDDVSSARLRLATDAEEVRDVLETVRDVAHTKDLRVIEPLAAGGEA